jgi:hypothetical protein
MSSKAKKDNLLFLFPGLIYKDEKEVQENKVFPKRSVKVTLKLVAVFRT